MMRTIIIGAFSGLLAGSLFVPAVYMQVKKERLDIKKPFNKIGVLATENGLIGEVFSFQDDCYIVVQTDPLERAKGSITMVCK